VKRVPAFAVVAAVVGLAFGVWTGVRAPHGSGSAIVPAALAIAMAISLALWLERWFRAPPESATAAFAPVGALLSISMLVGILPGVFWPDASAIRMAGSIASVLVATTAIVIAVRRRRHLRAGGESWPS
jgi:hypothetical protein